MYMTPDQKWQAAYATTKANFGLNDDAIGVFAIQLRFNLDDIKTIAAEAITGGGNDRKCDVLHIDKEMGIAVIAQCYVAQKARVAAKSNKAADLNTAVSWLLSADIQTLDQSLAGRAQELRDAISAGDQSNSLLVRPQSAHFGQCSKRARHGRTHGSQRFIFLQWRIPDKCIC